MNRRTMLKASAAAIGALAFDPERLLYVPGAKTYLDLHVPITTTLYDQFNRVLVTWVDGSVTKIVTDLERFQALPGQLGYLEWGGGARPWQVGTINGKWRRFEHVRHPQTLVYQG